MSVLLNTTFQSGVDGFSAGSQAANEGADFSNGVLQVGAATATVSFTAANSGKVLFSFWVKLGDTSTSASAEHDIYLLPTAGSVADTNAYAAIRLDRDNGSSTSTKIRIQYRNSSGWQNLDALHIRGFWVKISVVVNFATDTYDLYLQDVLWERGISVPNASAADVSRVSIVGAASAPTTDFDSFYVESAYSDALPTTTQVHIDYTAHTSGNLQDKIPGTDNININPQAAVEPDNLSSPSVIERFAFNGSGLGLQATNAEKELWGLYRCGPQGRYEAVWTISSTLNKSYAAVHFRTWEGKTTSLGTEDAQYVFRYAAASANDLVLFQGGNTVGSRATPTSTPSLGSDVTIAVEARGRYIDCYLNGTLQFSAKLDSTGARGLLAQHYAGPYLTSASSLTDLTNRCKSFTFKGPDNYTVATKTIGGLTIAIEDGAIPELYCSTFGSATENLLHDRGLQFGHQAEHDMGEDYAVQWQTAYDKTNVLVHRQRGFCMKENRFNGYAEPWVTFTRRGVWIAEKFTPLNGGGTYNLAPDNDVRPRRWGANSYRYVGDTGSSTLSAHTVESFTNVASVTMPAGFQLLADYGSGDKVLLTTIVGNIANTPSGSVSHKYTGSGAPISTMVLRATVADGTVYEFYRAYYLDASSSAALSNTILTGIRDDLKTIATFSFNTGSLKTNAAGDANADGFNERFGWTELNPVANVLDFTLNWGSITRYKPQFRVNSWTGGATVSVTIAGSPAVAGTDYWWDDLGDGTGLLQLAANIGANTAITLASPASSPRNFGGKFQRSTRRHFGG